jgi:hypothetical protein
MVTRESRSSAAQITIPVDGIGLEIDVIIVNVYTECIVTAMTSMHSLFVFVEWRWISRLEHLNEHGSSLIAIVTEGESTRGVICIIDS